MTIELQAHGMRYQLWLVRVANDGRSIVQHKALPLHVAEVVAAGNPAITAELKERGWVKVPVESKTMAEAGAELLFAATKALRLIDRINDGEVMATRETSRATASDLQVAINAYTDNVAPPEDEGVSLTANGGPPVFDRAGLLPDTIAVKAHRIVYPAGSEPLFDRAVLPDELDEDPELDADKTDRQLDAIKSHQMETKHMLHEAQTVLADVAEIAFTRAADASAAVLEIQGRLQSKGCTSYNPETGFCGKPGCVVCSRPEGALDLSLAGNLRALLVCLDPDAADNLVEPFAVLERITALVSELEKVRHETQESERSLDDALAAEREAARKTVHAAVDLLQVYLGNRPIAGSFEGTRLNDAIHDWLDLQPAGEATSATAQFIEKRMGIRDSAPVDLPSPKAVKATNLEHGWGGITAAEFAEGAASLPKPPKVPAIDADGSPLLPSDGTIGSVVARGVYWALDKLWPKT